MSYREKKSWITAIALTIVCAVYGYFMVQAYHVPEPNFNELGHLAVKAIIAFLIIEGALILFVYLKFPDDARTPQDERERLIEHRATAAAYRTLVGFASLSVFAMMHDYGHNWRYGHLVFASIIFAEITKNITQIVYFRMES